MREDDKELALGLDWARSTSSRPTTIARIAPRRVKRPS